MSERPTPRSDRLQNKERLRRRLKAGVFTALLALSWATTQATPAQAASGVLEQRVQTVRDALGVSAPVAGAPEAALNPWFNVWWNNWSNGWNNWNNAWHNWSNGWSNGGWNNGGWNNWSNWSNAWHNV
jgi:hypothetical protein